MKKFVYLVIMILISSCYNKNKEISILYLQQKIENYDIFFNKSFEDFQIIERAHYLDLNFNENCGCLLSGNKEKGLYIIHAKCKTNDSSLVEKKCQKFGDSLFTIFRRNKILAFYNGITSVTYNDDRNLIQIVTTLNDSTFNQLKQADNNFYDYEKDNILFRDYYLNKKNKYFYVLLYKFVDSIESKAFDNIKNVHTIRKIKDHWYYYRTYVHNRKINFENYYDECEY